MIVCISPLNKSLKIKNVPFNITNENKESFNELSRLRKNIDREYMSIVA